MSNKAIQLHEYILKEFRFMNKIHQDQIGMVSIQ